MNLLYSIIEKLGTSGLVFMTIIFFIVFISIFYTKDEDTKLLLKGFMIIFQLGPIVILSSYNFLNDYLFQINLFKRVLIFLCWIVLLLIYLYGLLSIVLKYNDMDKKIYKYRNGTSYTLHYSNINYFS